MPRLETLELGLPFDSCVKKPPFMSLGNGSYAPTLDYNMEVRSCIPATAMIPIAIPNEYIKDEYFVKPSNNIWDIIKDLSYDQIMTEVMQILSGSPGTYGIFLNTNLLQGGVVQWDFQEAQTGTSNTGTGSSNSGGGSGGFIKKGDEPGGFIKKGGKIGFTKKGESYSYLEGVDFGDIDSIVNNINNGLVPVIVKDLYGTLHLEWLQEPEKPTPTLFVVEHYKICSYLRDYGAGKTVSTFSLLPGEKTTISIRTYKKRESLRTRAEHVIDSFSEKSAKSLENIGENETIKTKTNTNNFNVVRNMTTGLKATVPLKKVNLDIDAQSVSNNQATFNTVRGNSVRDFDKTIDIHTADSSASRQVDINVSTTESYLEEREETITRQLENVNKSRVLNFVFRQLYQKYLTITYLDEVSFFFGNGYPETFKSVKLDGLYDLCVEICNTTAQAKIIFHNILRELCNVVDYQGIATAFIECYELVMNNCCQTCTGEVLNLTQKHVIKKRGLFQMYETLKIKGIILSVVERILPTDSVVCDALLGQGEALDCYNQHLQQAAVNAALIQNTQAALENAKLQQAMDIIDLIADPIQKAELYKKIFGNCCDVPQSGCNCGNITK